MAVETMQLRIRQITNEAEGINTFEFVDPNGKDLPEFAAGSHIDVHIPGGFLRQYSLCNDPRERHRYVVGVLNDLNSTGGSRSMHENVRAGDLIFPKASYDGRGPGHVMLAISSTQVLTSPWTPLHPRWKGTAISSMLDLTRIYGITSSHP